MALGDPAAVAAYREAVAVTTGTEHRLVRARLARAASLAGDLDTARAALAGLELEGDAADAPILLARGNLAYFTGDIDAAWDVAGRGPRRCCRRRTTRGTSWTWSSLQGLIAHQRGEWFERFRHRAAAHAGQAARWPPRCSTPTCASRSTCSTGRCPTPR